MYLNLPLFTYLYISSLTMRNPMCWLSPSNSQTTWSQLADWRTVWTRCLHYPPEHRWHAVLHHWRVWNSRWRHWRVENFQWHHSRISNSPWCYWEIWSSVHSAEMPLISWGPRSVRWDRWVFSILGLDWCRSNCDALCRLVERGWGFQLKEREHPKYFHELLHFPA